MDVVVPCDAAHAVIEADLADFHRLNPVTDVIKIFLDEKGRSTTTQSRCSCCVSNF